MPIWLLLVVMTLATYRGTRLAVKDDFPPLLWIRDRVAGGGKGGWRQLTTAEREDLAEKVRSGVGSVPWSHQSIDGTEHRYVPRAAWSPAWIGDLLSCPWCASGWIAGVVTFSVDLTTSLPQPVLCGFAVWGAAALIGSRPTT